MFDFFCSKLICPICDNVSADDTSTNMQTKIARHPSMLELRVGDRIDADWDSIVDSGYVDLTAHPVGNTLSLVETWECSECGNPFNWAKITIKSGFITSIESMELNLSNLKECNFITEDVRFILPNVNMQSSKINVNDLVSFLKAQGGSDNF